MDSPPTTSVVATRERVQRLGAAAGLEPRVLGRIHAIAGAPPSAGEWLGFLRWVLLGLGVALLLAALTTLVAFNWAALGRFAKLGLAVALVAGAVVGSWRAGDGSLGRALLVVAAVAVGPLLAVYGQSYQTGADPYELFVGWLVLVAPWVVLARSPALWLVAAVLANVAGTLFWSEVLDTSTFGELHLVAALAVLDGAIWALFDGVARPRRWVAGRWHVRVVGLWSVGLVAVALAAMILGEPRDPPPAPALAIAAAGVAEVVACMVIYRRRVPDLFMLAVVLAAVIGLVTLGAGRLMLDGPSRTDALVAVFVLGMLVLGQVAGATWWLRREARAQRGEPAPVTAEVLP